MSARCRAGARAPQTCRRKKGAEGFQELKVSQCGCSMAGQGRKGRNHRKQAGRRQHYRTLALFLTSGFKENARGGC